MRIKFETAKIANNKGFEWIWGVSFDTFDDDLFIDSPEQSYVQKWLREEHGVAVLVDLDITLSWIYKIISLHPEASYTGDFIQSYYVYNTFEKALEEGLIKVLNLLPDVWEK